MVGDEDQVEISQERSSRLPVKDAGFRIERGTVRQILPLVTNLDVTEPLQARSTTQDEVERKGGNAANTCTRGLQVSKGQVSVLTVGAGLIRDHE